MIKKVKRLLPSQKSLIQLNYIFSLLILLAMGSILSAALFLQVVDKEIPCPLCLLQRVTYLGICFGIILNLRCGYSLRHDGLILLTTVLLLIISTRQTLLDIYPRVGHEYVGTAILGLHMPVWSIIIAVCLLLAYALRFSILGYGDYLTDVRIESYPKIKLVAYFFAICIIALCAINLMASFLQCGFESCHTTGYRLLH